ncbi:MAG TPA: hypothetical protein VMT85_11250 [Thermoanaerobaculia bacterium]|nr:hypothetical protein [Thermoanaerobaculia bacterium]
MHHFALSSRRHLLAALATLSIAALSATAAHAQADLPRMPDGKPDLSGTYDVATLTPTERPAALGEQLALDDEEAARIARQAEARFELFARASDPDREAPPAGGNVGGYNFHYLDPGSAAIRLDGKWRTSILTDPPDGRYPPMTERGAAMRQERLDLWGRNADNLQDRSDAWWLEREGTGPFDGPEIRPLGERCMLGFGSPAGPPVLPVVYNNLKRVIQTRDRLVILAEMVHDARIVRIGGEHEPPDAPRRWLGDSVGRWEGDTLVVETRNFKPGLSPLSAPGLRQNYVTSGELRVIERFSRIDADTLRYEFTVHDPVVWTAPWSGEYPWPATEDGVYEYACHEGNYAMGNILRGARLAERATRAGQVSSTGARGDD